MPLPEDYVNVGNNLFQFLSTNGDETGTIDAIGDYSSGITDFFIAPPTGELYILNRMLVCIQCTGLLATRKYGDQAELTNGIKLCMYNGKMQTNNELSAVPIKSHDDWAGLCFDAVAPSYGNVAGKTVTIRWTFAKSGKALYLNGNLGDKFLVHLNDNFSGLEHHRFQIQGYKQSIY